MSGNWSGDYRGGKAPTEWIGSIKILRQYMDTKTPVKFGQCWVFSGLVTTSKYDVNTSGHFTRIKVFSF